MNNPEQKLENLNPPQTPSLENQPQLKLSILNAKKSARASLFLLAIPFSILGSALIETLFKVALPPWSWLKTYNPQLPLWERQFIFVTIVIVCPLIALALNILSIVWLQYDKAQKVLHISIRLRTVNTIIIIIAGLLAFLFIGHAIADWIAGKD